MTRKALRWGPGPRLGLLGGRFPTAASSEGLQLPACASWAPKAVVEALGAFPTGGDKALWCR